MMPDIVSNPQKMHTHQAHEGKLHFGTDCWTSPNRWVYMVVMSSMQAHRHTGAELMAQFVKVLDVFGIGDKVSSSECR